MQYKIDDITLENTRLRYATDDQRVKPSHHRTLKIIDATVVFGYMWRVIPLDNGWLVRPYGNALGAHRVPKDSDDYYVFIWSEASERTVVTILLDAVIGHVFRCVKHNSSYAGNSLEEFLR
jgi:hypothetical protein